MKNLLSLALASLLLGSAVVVRAAALPGESRRYVFADKALDAVAVKISDVKKCLAYWDSLKGAVAAKKEEVAGDNGGTVPAAYDEFFAIRNVRVSRVYSACLALNNDLSLDFDQAHMQIKAIDPGSAPGIPKRRERLTNLKNLSNTLIKRLR